MTTETIRSARLTEEERVLATMTYAFENDPVVRWVFRGEEAYRTYFPRVVSASAGKSIENGTAFCTDALEAVALWLPPGVNPDEDALASAVEQGSDADGDDLAAFLEQMNEQHPAYPHWYLPFMGVAPSMQGRGHGSALLARALAICDEERLPAYLEASTDRNRALYGRHGFRNLGVLQAGSSPPAWTMLREPRRA
jgi:GNAT superfamily N-acetyltransferase